MLRIMLRMTSDGSGVCYESRQTMSQACDISEKTITAVIKSLEDKKLIIVDRKHRRSHKISLHPDVKNILGGKFDPPTRVNIDLDRRSFLPSRKDHDMGDESAKRPRKKRKPTTAVKKKRVIKYTSDLDKIHDRYLNSLKGKPEEGDGS